jgi:hypothetical protein
VGKCVRNIRQIQAYLEFIKRKQELMYGQAGLSARTKYRLQESILVEIEERFELIKHKLL